MMALPQTRPAHQIAAVRPLADEVYGSTRGAPLLNQAKNELELLLTVLSTAETQSALLQQEKASPEFERTIEDCHSTLLELQKLQKCNGGVGTQSQISDIRARFSDLIFELSVMNANMMISSQNHLNRVLREFIDDIKAGTRNAKVVADSLHSVGCPEQDEAWDKLQGELQEAGVSPELSTQDREMIISVFQKAADQEDLMKDIDQKPPGTEIPPTADTAPPTILINSEQRPEHLPETAAVPFHDERLSDKEAIPEENFPITVASELQDMDDSSKQAVPHEDFPIPVAMEPILMPEDFDKHVVPPDVNLPIPVEPASTSHSRSGSVSDNGSSVSNKKPAPPPSISRGKKPSLVSRMKYKLSSSKEEFVTLVEMGGLYSIKFALDRGADVNSENREGKTALMVAVSLGLEDVVSLLLEYGAKIDEMGDYGETALGNAALKGYDDIVQLLLVSGAAPDAGKNRGRTALSQAAIRGSMSITKMLVEWGADVNSISPTGHTALSYAALNGWVQIVQFLLENGAIVDKTSYPRRTPLFKAVSQGNIRCVELLLAFGADPHRKDIRGESPMELAAVLGNADILSMFYGFGFGFKRNAEPAHPSTAPPPSWSRPTDRKSATVFQYY